MIINELIENKSFGEDYYPTPGRLFNLLILEGHFYKQINEKPATKEEITNLFLNKFEFLASEERKIKIEVVE